MISSATQHYMNDSSDTSYTWVDDEYTTATTFFPPYQSFSTTIFYEAASFDSFFIYKNFYIPAWPDVRARQEQLFSVLIATIFNIYAAAFNRRAIFSKSGFVGRVAKRRKGR